MVLRQDTVDSKEVLEVLEITTFDFSSADGMSDVSRHTLYIGSINLSPCGLIILISFFCHMYTNLYVRLS